MFVIIAKTSPLQCQYLVTFHFPWRESAIPLKRGDVFFHVTPSGGGHGDPMVRDPQLVLADVIEEKLSRERALKAYGVVIEGDPPRVDEAATRELRASSERAAP